MLCEELVRTQNDELNLSVTVRVRNLARPRSEEQLRDELLAHALDCHECLTVVLFQEDSLAKCGCETYRKLFREATEELERQLPIDPSVHLNEELVQAFFLDQLSEDQLCGMAEHVENCEACRIMLMQKQDLHLALKTAAAEDPSHAEPTALRGVVGVAAPDRNLQICSPLA